jgi:hypothetical protein
VFSSCRMKRKETESILVDIGPPRKPLIRVCDPGAKRVPELWVRTHIYYAQIRAGSHKTRVHLEHADTVP